MGEGNEEAKKDCQRFYKKILSVAFLLCSQCTLWFKILTLNFRRALRDLSGESFSQERYTSS